MKKACANNSKKRLYAEVFKQKSAIYFGKQIEFEEILSRFNQYIKIL